jgi:hypothetical protein
MISSTTEWFRIMPRRLTLSLKSSVFGRNLGELAIRVILPEPDELEADFNGLKQWQAEFKMRPLTPVLKVQ